MIKNMFTKLLLLCLLSLYEAPLKGQTIYIFGDPQFVKEYATNIINIIYLKNPNANRLTLKHFESNSISDIKVLKIKKNTKWIDELNKDIIEASKKNPITTRPDLFSVLNLLGGLIINEGKNIVYYDPLNEPSNPVISNWTYMVDIEKLHAYLGANQLSKKTILVINAMKQSAEIGMKEQDKVISTAKPGIFRIQGTYSTNVGIFQGFQYRLGKGKWINIPNDQYEIKNSEEWELYLDLKLRNSEKIELRPLVNGYSNSLYIDYNFVNKLDVALLIPESGGQASNCRQRIDNKIYKGYMFEIQSNIDPRQLDAVFKVVYQSGMDVEDLNHADISLRDDDVEITKGNNDKTYCVFINFDKLFGSAQSECINSLDKYSLVFNLKGEERNYISDKYIIGFSPFNIKDSDVPYCLCK